METPSFKEDHISQIPALQRLQKLGYTYLPQAEAAREQFEIQPVEESTAAAFLNRIEAVKKD